MPSQPYIPDCSPYKLKLGDHGPKPIYTPDPEYTLEARKAHLQGTVVLSLMLGTDGVPHDIKVERELGMGLGNQAVQAVKQWRFLPAVRNGEAVATKLNIEVNFRFYK